MVSKIIVGRIRLLISTLISPIQATFVPGRKGIDNVVIAQELFYALDKEKRETRVHGHQGRLGESLIGWSGASSIKCFKLSNFPRISFV